MKPSRPGAVRYYPAFLDLSGTDVLVVGGGDIGLWKIYNMLECGARVTAVAPDAKPQAVRLAREGKIRLLRRRFQKTDLRGRQLVICATNDEDLNRRVGETCRRKGIFANVVDRTALCGFILPAVVRRGDVVFAVSTGGASPALAKFLKMKLEKTFGAEAGIMARVLKEYRPALLAVPKERKTQILSAVINDAVLKKLRREGPAFLKKKLGESLAR